MFRDKFCRQSNYFKEPIDGILEKKNEIQSKDYIRPSEEHEKKIGK